MICCCCEKLSCTTSLAEIRSELRKQFGVGVTACFLCKGEEVNRLQLLHFHSLLFALPSTVCSAIYQPSISLLALLSTVSTSSTNKWTICPVSVFPIPTISPKSLAQTVNLKYQKSAIKLFRLKMTHHPTPHSLLTNFLKVIRLERGNWILQ